MFAVHKAAGMMPKAEYGVFATLLQVLNQMTIPAVGLQLSFAQITVDSDVTNRPEKLRGALRAVMLGTFAVWLLMAVPTLVFQDWITTEYKIQNPAALWLTLLLGLASLWSPVILGTVQGRQNFLWLGWAFMLNGLTRLAAITVIIFGFCWIESGAGAQTVNGFLTAFLTGTWLMFNWGAAASVLGALLGMVISMAIGVWQTREDWCGPAAPFEWLPWLKRLLPLTIGFGGVIFMMSLDMIVVRRYFPAQETGYYGAAGMIGRAIYFFTAPLTAVLFPKIVDSAARSEKSNVLFLALSATALMGGVAALFCTFFPQVPLRLVYDSSFLKIAPLVPVFAWCMLPLTLSSVLINNLLARSKFAVVPWLALLAVGYFFALSGSAEISASGLHVYNPWLDQVFDRPAGVKPADFVPVVKTLGTFASLMMGICLFFTWRGRARAAGQSEAIA
jgi:O-antigen/teichoic acid export membrane protein